MLPGCERRCWCVLGWADCVTLRRGAAGHAPVCVAAAKSEAHPAAAMKTSAVPAVRVSARLSSPVGQLPYHGVRRDVLSVAALPCARLYVG